MKLKMIEYFNAVLDLPPCADKLLFYMIFVHNPYEPMPPIQELHKMFGFAKETLTKSLNLLLQRNFLRKTGNGAWRKLYVNPGVVWVGNEQSRQMQIKKLDALARRIKDPSVNEWEELRPSKPKKPGLASNFRRVQPPPLGHSPEDAE